MLHLEQLFTNKRLKCNNDWHLLVPQIFQMKWRHLPLLSEAALTYRAEEWRKRRIGLCDAVLESPDINGFPVTSQCSMIASLLSESSSLHVLVWILLQPPTMGKSLKVKMYEVSDELSLIKPQHCWSCSPENGWHAEDETQTEEQRQRR